MPRTATATAPRRGRRRRASLSAWYVRRFLAMVARRAMDERSLYLAVNGDGRKWLAMAVEGPTLVPNPAALFDDHGHKAIGIFASMGAAKRAARSFARRWQRGYEIEECPCDEVSA